METGRKIRILLIEDNLGDVDLIRFALQRAKLDCELTVINDGGEALALVRRVNALPNPVVPDLILLDLNLPKADGREILTEMRSTSTFADVPVVILTSSSWLREREQLESLRIARHITKPPDLDAFLRLGFVVREVLDDYAAGAAKP